MQTNEIAMKMVLSGWKIGQDKIEKALAILSDDDMDMELMPDGNRVSWVVGHLAAVNDSLLTILGLGEKLNEDYYDYFLNDDSPVETPTVQQTRDYWNITIERLNESMAELSARDWFDRHMTVSAEDFAKEPHRNRLNVLLSRTYHLNHHYGQLALVLKTITA